MPDERRELQTIRPASHTTALGELFIADERRVVQAGICGAKVFPDLIPRGASGGLPGGNWNSVNINSLRLGCAACRPVGPILAVSRSRQPCRVRAVPF
jgi:hypothetical protein